VKACTNDASLPGSGLTAANLSACLHALEGAPPACASEPPECTVAGTLQGGAACNGDVQCASGVCNVSITAGAPVPFCGACLPVPVCGAGKTPCAVGTFCNGTADTASCQPIVYGKAGDACDNAFAECATGLTCDFTGASGGTCVVPAPMGGACTSGNECLVGACAQGVCVTPTYGKAGDPCNGNDQRCLVGSCAISGSGISGTCPTVIADGQPCTLGDPTTTCDTESECANGVCAGLDSMICK
jgi:hypothetical protein